MVLHVQCACSGGNLPMELLCDCPRQSIISDSLRGAPPPGHPAEVVVRLILYDQCKKRCHSDRSDSEAEESTQVAKISCVRESLRLE